MAVIVTVKYWAIAMRSMIFKCIKRCAEESNRRTFVISN